MSANAAILFLFAMVCGWNGAVLGVTAYAVFWLGHSGWWFLLALLLLRPFGRSEG